MGRIPRDLCVEKGVRQNTLCQKYLKLAKSQIFGNDDFEIKFTEYDQEGPKELYLSKKISQKFLLAYFLLHF